MGFTVRSFYPFLNIIAKLFLGLGSSPRASGLRVLFRRVNLFEIYLFKRQAVKQTVISS
jgi:hypothetical protein